MKTVRYSIRDLEKLTGIKTHTIRMWEKRYNILNPARTNTNIRYYCDDDLRKLLNINILKSSGYKISHISKLTGDQILTTVSELSVVNKLVDADINNLIIAAVDLKEDYFESVLNSCLIKFGFERTFCDVIFPVCRKISLMWQIGRISACQQRFINNLIRQKLLVAIDGLSGDATTSKGSFLLFMPLGHNNDIGLLFANYIIRKHGYSVVYLGPDVPFEHLKQLGSPDKFQHLFFCLNRVISKEQILSYINDLRSVYLDHEIHVAMQDGIIPFDPDQENKLNVYKDFISFSQKLDEKPVS